MSKIVKIVIGLVGVLSMASLATFAGWQPMNKQVVLAAKPIGQSMPVPPRAMTLLEAWDTLSAYGKTWQTQAAIASIRSFDVDGDTAVSGQDGYRRGWMAVLVGQDASLWLRLADGVVVDQTVQPLSPGFSALSRPSVDSPEALASAQAAKPGFGASQDKKGQGFHFVVDLFDENREEIGVMGAVGQWPAQIRLDPHTGAVLSSQIYTYAPSGGILYSTDSGQSWKASTLREKMVIALSPDPRQEKRAYAVAAEKESIVLSQSGDSGKTWQLMGHLPQQAGSWPFDLLAFADPSGQVSLLVGTWNGLWISKDGQNWSQVAGLPDGPAQWLAAIQSKRGHRFLVSISSGKNRGLYSSRDLTQWTKVEENVYRLSGSFDGQMVLATSEEKIDQGLVFNLGSERVVSLPGPALTAAGDFEGRGSMLLRSPSGLSVAQGIEHPVRWTLSVPVSSLAASPDFLTSQRAIAGGFRSGIYRTTDGGKHWEQVLAKPSDIVQGTNEIYEVVFLSPTTVIAINGGELTWQDF